MEKAMKMNFLQAYKQAPWRKQLQWIGIFLAILVAVTAVAGIYLSISRLAATSGRRIQNLESTVNDLKLEVNDLNTELALISSARSMSQRLEGAEMVEVDPPQAIYIEVPGYVSLDSGVLAPPPSAEEVETPTLLPEFTASLWDWFRARTAGFALSGIQATEVVP